MKKFFDVIHHASKIDSDLATAMYAAQQAVNEIQRFELRTDAVTQKSYGNFVTQADLSSQKTIECELKKVHPKDAILSEENQFDSSARCNPRLWVVDPLDSTTGYIFNAGQDFPAVMIALLENQQIKLGVIAFPFTAPVHYYYAVSGKGAYKNGRVLEIKSKAPSLDRAWVDINQYADVSLETDTCMRLRTLLRTHPGGARLVTSMVPHSGIVCKIIETALSAVIHDNNPEKVKQNVWDAAPAQIILEEAGGVFLNRLGERYNPFKPCIAIAAESKKLADEICRFCLNNKLVP